MKIDIDDKMIATAMRAAEIIATNCRIRPHYVAFGEQSDIHRFTPRFVGELAVIAGFKAMGLKYDYDAGDISIFAGGSRKTVKVVTSDRPNLVCVTEPLDHDAMVACRIDQASQTIEVLGAVSKKDFKLGMSIDKLPLTFESLGAFDKE